MMTKDIGLAFLEGLGLIASPCILPVLPLVLASSIEGGRSRPFGIITGFVLAFTAFALLSRQLVAALNIDLDYIKYGSLVLLAIFGVILLSSTLSEKFATATQRFANAGANLTSNNKDGYLSGVLIGALIGLVWTPCAGPFLAAVLVQVIRQENNLQGLFVILAFAIGAGVPMLIIALMGRKVMGKLGFFTRHAEAVRRTFGALMLIAVVFIATGIDPQSFFTSSRERTTADMLSPEAMKDLNAEKLVGGLAQTYAAPEFSGNDAWLNSTPLTIKSLKGKVVLIDFWTYSCINCVRTLPYLTAWDEKYRSDGLVIVGVHSPEFEFEKKRANVEAAIEKHQIRYPVALDNKLDTWTSFKNQYWPAHYLINKDGKVVYTHFGEGSYAQTENNIRFLLGLKGSADSVEEPAVLGKNQISETYLGYGRAQNFKSLEPVSNGKKKTYSLPKNLKANEWALSGPWKIEAERVVSQGTNSELKLNFNARKVFLVLANSSGKPLTATISLNGERVAIGAGKDAPHGEVSVRQNTLYELIDQAVSKPGVIDIKPSGAGLEAYAFTFGN